jgi:Ran GTPase-activating protein (RanGAP) involved in mRNA processing and transport
MTHPLDMESTPHCVQESLSCDVSSEGTAIFKTDISCQRLLPVVLRQLEAFCPSSDDPNVRIIILLSQCRFRHEDMDSLLRSLRLHHNHVSHICLSPRGSEESASDAHVDAETADIGDVGAFKLCRVLCECDGFASALRELHLGYCAIESKGISYISRAIGKLPALCSLSLDGNEGIGSNFVVLAEALQYMTHLLHLNISNCSLGSHGARVFSTIIPFVYNLKSLQLTHNHIFGRSMHRICATLSSLTDLRLLDLSNNSLEEHGARDLSRSLKCCPMLTHLSVPSPHIPPNSFQKTSMHSLIFHVLEKLFTWRKRNPVFVCRSFT